MPVSPSAARRRAAGLLQWLGLPGVVLLAALLCDLAIVAKASIDSLGTPGIDLLLLPGILGLSACALWARTQPVTAAWTAAVVLVAGTVLIRANAVSAYTTLLPNITFAETVAGLEIVYFCVRAASSGMAFATTAALVTATLVAVAGRDGAMTFRDMLPAFAGGLILLVLVVVPALQYRRGDGGARSALATLLRKQWLLVGVLALTLFFDTYSSAAAGWGGSLVLLTTAAAAVTVVFALRKPFAGALALAAVLALCAISVAMLSRALPFNDIGGFPMTAVVSGMMVSAFLVRHVQPGRAVGAIALLSTVVGLGAVVNVYPHVDLLQSMAVGAVLLLGISVAIGLYLRARDSERTQAVEAAVSEAQTAERMALARELHDVVAHHVTGIVVQAQAARMLAERDPRVVVDALGQIEHAGTDALAAMRRLVRSMRGDAPAGSSEFSEQATTDLDADLRRLVDAGNHGVATELDLDLPPDLPQEVARSALRIVQESLTNVGKHAAGATRARVSVRAVGTGEPELHIRVSDDGDPGAQGASAIPGGYGLVGMRERVDLLRGRLAAGPGPDGGWLVEAWLPLAGDEAGDETQ